MFSKVHLMFSKKLPNYGFTFCILLITILHPYKPLNAQKKTINNKNLNTSENKHSPHKATIYSMVIPGLGQAYNKKYWKIPIVYTGFGIMIYFINSNKTEYTRFSDTYDFVQGDLTKTPYKDYAEKYSPFQLKQARDIYRRNLDYSYIITGIWYILNIIDATVDAHLFEFEVTEDLSFDLKPEIKFLPHQIKPYTGLKLSFTFPFSKN